ncbi:hypothetical protein THRCLA_05769 [Thraustotheca clavata]|uniref:Uncharacterized protein n=1 Tax=Thraustotheca clavata TaxID=74557 RepID=A0A1V9ZT78_9STRA|nr:hypothetical protein THRCLA_05769 [Thraustotheca clavata]
MVDDGLKMVLMDICVEITHYSTTYEHLRKKHKTLKAQIVGLQKQLHSRKSELYLDTRINERQEQKEQEWEAQMEEGKNELEQLEGKISTIQLEIEGLDEEIVLGDERAAIDQTLLAGENETLEELLQLRAEEKNDLLAALDALKRKREQQVAKSEKVETSQSAELVRLKSKRDALKKSIMAQEQNVEDDVPTDRVSVEARTKELTEALRQAQEKLNSESSTLMELKSKMQLIVEKATNVVAPGSVSHTAAVLLHLLDLKKGEMTMTELKSEAMRLVQADSTLVVRSIYALVGSALIQIDRTQAESIVTSLII